MPVSAKTPRSTTTRKPISWAFGAVITGIVDASTITQAAQIARAEKAKTPAAVAWLIDASGATKVMPDALAALSQQLATMAGLGLTRVALVLPPEDFNDMIISVIMSRVPRDPQTGNPLVGLQVFASERQALHWFSSGCK